MRSEQEVRDKIKDLERQLEVFSDRKERRVDTERSVKTVHVIEVLLVAHYWFLKEENPNNKSNGKI